MSTVYAPNSDVAEERVPFSDRVLVTVDALPDTPSWADERADDFSDDPDWRCIRFRRHLDEGSCGAMVEQLLYPVDDGRFTVSPAYYMANDSGEYDAEEMAVFARLLTKTAAIVREADRAALALVHPEIAPTESACPDWCEAHDNGSEVHENGYQFAGPSHHSKTVWVSRGYDGDPIGVKLSMYPDDGQLWVNLGAEECLPEQAAALAHAIRQAGVVALK